MNDSQDFRVYYNRRDEKGNYVEASHSYAGGFEWGVDDKNILHVARISTRGALRQILGQGFLPFDDVAVYCVWTRVEPE